MQSTNVITNASYQLPSSLSDKVAIDDFVQKNSGKKVVVVQGLGFVGAVMSIVLANALTEEYAVIGIDLPNESSYWKIRSINEGVFPVTSSDPKIEEYYQNSRVKGNLYATYDPYAYSLAEVVIVDINLDVQKKSDDQSSLIGYEVDLDPFRAAVTTIAQNSKEDVLLLVETTVPPGTCEKVIKPIFENCFSQRGLDHTFRIGHSYERVMPGPGYVDSIQNFYRVYAGIDEASAHATREFLTTIISTEKYPLTRLHSTTASEMSKVLENSYRAMNIAFIDEWTAFAEEAGVNLYEVIGAIRLRPTHRNIMLPGLGVGGYCLPKDPLLASWSRQNLFNGSALAQSEASVNVNDRMPHRTFNHIIRACGELRGKTVALLGVSYLENVGDTRYTPVEPLYNWLKRSGAKVIAYDSFVPYWSEVNLFTIPLNDLLTSRPDVLVFCTKHHDIVNNINIDHHIHASNELIIVDAASVLSHEQVSAYSRRNKVSVVGRGDL